MKTLVLVLLITIWCPRASSAMEIAFYDQMAVQDQKEYLKYLVRTAEQVLTEEGRPDLAKQVKLLFKASGNKAAEGEALFQDGMKFNRTWLIEHPNGMLHLGADAALMYVLSKTHISDSLPHAFSHRMEELYREKPFWAKRPLRTN